MTAIHGPRHRIALVLPGRESAPKGAPAMGAQPCGVLDYTMGLAAALSDAADCAVFCTGDRDLPARAWGGRFEVRSVADRWDLAAVGAMTRSIAAWNTDLALIQYMPYLCDPRGLSLTAPLLALGLRSRGIRVGVVMHEIVSPPRLSSPWSMVRAAGQMLVAGLLGALSHTVIVTGRDRARLMRRLLPVIGGSIHTIPVGSNLPVGFASSDERSSYRRGLGIPDTAFVMSIFGKNHDSKMPGWALEALLAVRESGLDARLIVIGDLMVPSGPYVLNLGFLPALDAARSLACADLYLLPLRDGVSTRRTTLAAALAQGLPVLTTRGPHTDPEIFDTGCVALADSGDVKAFGLAARDLAASAQRRRDLSARGAALHARLLCWREIARQYLQSCVEPIRVDPISRAAADAGWEIDRNTPVRPERRPHSHSRRIALVHVDLPEATRGGVAYQVHYLANALVDRGHRVTVVTAGPPGPSARYAVRTASIPRWVLDSKLWRPLLAARYLARSLPPDADVVHFHGDDHWPRCRVPSVRTFYGSALFELMAATSWKRRASQAATYPLEWLGGLQATLSVAISRHTALALPFVGDIVPCGFDPRIFGTGGRRSPFPTILFVGTMRGRKRGNLLLDVFTREIRPRVPGAQLWLVSDEEPGTPAPLGVHHLGRVDTRTLARLYRRAWVFALPSSYEGFGVPYLEAMASGTPIVATDNAGAREVVGSEGAGLLTTPEHLGSGIASLLADEGQRAQMGLSARRRAIRFTIDRIASAYEEIYERAIVLCGRRSLADDAITACTASNPIAQED